MNQKQKWVILKIHFCQTNQCTCNWCHTGRYCSIFFVLEWTHAHFAWFSPCYGVGQGGDGGGGWWWWWCCKRWRLRHRVGCICVLMNHSPKVPAFALYSFPRVRGLVCCLWFIYSCCCCCSPDTEMDGLVDFRSSESCFSVRCSHFFSHFPYILLHRNMVSVS